MKKRKRKREAAAMVGIGADTHEEKDDYTMSILLGLNSDLL